ncbi:hypothetical protein EVAR_27054_1 [Eumeta japonica]|uniref:Uncharacterized protein n=1 Tax=Eumeta variegata TaxID=151549 RepID=A0A4C1WFR7_EUMVA|nr:hypothetical protein EVAR_27054_1 [Eumeta japonica]
MKVAGCGRRDSARNTGIIPIYSYDFPGAAVTYRVQLGYQTLRARTRILECNVADVFQFHKAKCIRYDRCVCYVISAPDNRLSQREMSSARLRTPLTPLARPPAPRTATSEITPVHSHALGELAVDGGRLLSEPENHYVFVTQINKLNGKLFITSSYEPFSCDGQKSRVTRYLFNQNVNMKIRTLPEDPKEREFLKAPRSLPFCTPRTPMTYRDRRQASSWHCSLTTPSSICAALTSATFALTSRGPSMSWVDSSKPGGLRLIPKNRRPSLSYTEKVGALWWSPEGFSTHAHGREVYEIDIFYLLLVARGKKMHPLAVIVRPPLRTFALQRSDHAERCVRVVSCRMVLRMWSCCVAIRVPAPLPTQISFRLFTKRPGPRTVRLACRGILHGALRERLAKAGPTLLPIPKWRSIQATASVTPAVKDLLFYSLAYYRKSNSQDAPASENAKTSKPASKDIEAKAPTAAKVATKEADIIVTPTPKKTQKPLPLFIHDKG